MITFLAACLLTLAGMLALVEAFLRAHEAVEPPRPAATAPWAAFGDSHVANGLMSTAQLDNLGRASANLEELQAALSGRLAAGGLAGVVLQADPQVFAPYRLAARARESQDGEERFLRLLRPSHRPYLGMIMISALSWAVSAPQGDATPTAFLDKPEPLRRRDAQLRVQLHAPLADLEKSEAAMRYLRLVKGLRDRDIAVCLVRFPVSSVYAEETARIPTFGTAESFFKRVAAEAGVPFVDLLRAMPDKDFSDPDHLLPEAATRLTPLLMRECAVSPGR